MSKRGNKSVLSTVILVLAILMALGIAFIAVCYFAFSSDPDVTVGKVEAPVSEEAEIEDISDSDTEENNKSEETKDTAKQGKSIQDEIAEVEAKVKENSSSWDSENATQDDMNNSAAETANLWDAELNSLWSRLTEEVDASKKDELTKEQKAWIAEKDANTQVAGLYAHGGSMSAMLEAEEIAAMTRERVYVLAGYLAEARGESFSVPSDVQKELDSNKSLDQTFEELSGEWIFDESRGAAIGVQKTSECEYGVPGSKWTVWITGGDVLSDLDLYGYSGMTGTVVLKKDNPDGSLFYEITTSEGGDKELILSCEPSFEELVQSLNEPIFAKKVK